MFAICIDWLRLLEAHIVALQPLLVAEIAHCESRGENHQADGEDVAKREAIAILEGVDPLQLGHKLKVHTIDTRHQGRGHKYHSSDGEYLHNLVLLDVDKTERRVLDIVQTLEREVGMRNERVDVLNHQLKARIDIVREALGAQDAREDALTVEDVLAEDHCALLQGAEAQEDILVDGVLLGDGLGERRYLTAHHLDEVGIEVDSHLEE